MVGVIVTGDMRFESGDAERLQVRHRLPAVVQHTVIDHHHLALRADDERGIALADIEEVELEVAVGRRHRSRAHRGGDGERNGHESGEQTAECHVGHVSHPDEWRSAVPAAEVGVGPRCQRTWSQILPSDRRSEIAIFAK